MPTTIDAIDNLSVEFEKYGNELTTLIMLKEGLLLLANSIRGLESRYTDIAMKHGFSSFGGKTSQEKAELNRIACMFHWFGTSVCNYARLVGFIRGVEVGEFMRSDLEEKRAFAKIKKSVDGYLKGISELEPVVVWRNKVAGHFAITYPHNEDNIATLNLSVMFPVSLESGIYHVGGMALMQKNPRGVFTSEIPMWSVSKVFESLVPRFWPDIVRTKVTEEDGG